MLLFLFPLSLRLSCKKRPARSKPLDSTPFRASLSIPLRSLELEASSSDDSHTLHNYSLNVKGFFEDFFNFFKHF